jgi:hypothetical protein
MNIEILDGVPIPPYSPGRKFRFPFDRLEIGQCFIVPGATTARIGPYKAYAQRKLGRKFITRKKEGTVYVWRIQ